MQRTCRVYGVNGVEGFVELGLDVARGRALLRVLGAAQRVPLLDCHLGMLQHVLTTDYRTICGPPLGLKLWY